MAAEWYWKHRGELRGPISTEDLDDLIRHHRIDNRDELRPVESEDWLSGETVKAMFARARAGDTEKSTVDAAARLLQQRRLPGAGEGKGKNLFQSIPLADGLKSAGAMLSGLFDQIITGLSSALYSLRCFRNRWVALIVAAILLLSIHLGQRDFSGAENRRIYELYSQLLSEVRRLQSIKASDAEWMHFQETQKDAFNASRESLKRIDRKFPGRYRPGCYDFEQENGQARFELIQAGYRFQELLQMGKDAKPDAVTGAEKSLTNIQDVFSGKFLTQLKIARSKPSVRKSPAASNTGIDPLIAGIIAVDGVLLLGGGFFLWRWLAKR